MKKQFLKAAGAKASAATFLMAITLPTMTIADNVTLTSYDGSTQIMGDLLSYDNGRYRVETALGELLISANVMACTGGRCPTFAELQADLLAARKPVIDQDARPILSSSN